MADLLVLCFLVFLSLSYMALFYFYVLQFLPTFHIYIKSDNRYMYKDDYLYSQNLKREKIFCFNDEY